MSKVEERRLKALIGKAGGTAGKGALNYRMSIPSKWAVDMGVTQDNRDLIVTYDEKNKEIIIRKA